MNLTVRKEGPWAPENFQWIGSKHGIDSTDTITLNTALFTAVTAFATQGYVPGGVALGRVTATGQVGPYNDAATDGRQTCIGFLFGSKSLVGAGPALGGALVNHGKVREALLPANHGVDAAAKADLKGQIIFI